MTDAPPFVGRAALLVSAAAVTAGAVAVAGLCVGLAWVRGWLP